MICDDSYWVFCSGEVMLPFFESLNDGKKFPIRDVILCWGEGGRVEAQGWRSLLESFCISTPPVAIKEVSVMTKNGFIVSGMWITGAKRNTSLSLINTSSCSCFQSKGTPFLVKSWRGQARAEKFGMNLQ